MKVEITSDELRESVKKAKEALKPEKGYNFWTHLMAIVYTIVYPKQADQRKCEKVLSELVVDTEKAVGTIKYLEQTIVEQKKEITEIKQDLNDQKQINAEKDKQIKQLEQKVVDGAVKSEYDKQQLELMIKSLHKMITEMQEENAKSKLEQKLL